MTNDQQCRIGVDDTTGFFFNRDSNNFIRNVLYLKEPDFG